MEIQLTTTEDRTEAKLLGVLDERASGPFADQLHPLVSQPGGALVLDMSGVRRITSAGISALVSLVVRANTNGSKVILAALTPFVDEVFRVARLGKFIEIADSVADARNRLGS